MAPPEVLRQVQSFFDEAAPRWSGRQFDRHLMEALVGRVGLCPGDRVLDLGGGAGHLLPALRGRVGRRGALYLVDLSMGMLREASGRAAEAGAHRCCGLAEHLPLRAASLDGVLCMGLFPHLTDRRAWLAEMRRVLVPGGRLAVLHLIGRVQLNALHAGIGGTVADHLLPPADEVASGLAAAGFVVGQVCDGQDRFLVTASRTPDPPAS